jgi:Flp pilus assembly protein TadG
MTKLFASFERDNATRLASYVIANVSRYIAGRLKLLRRNEDGGVAVIAAVGVPVAVILTGAAVSFSSGLATRTDLQAAMDASVLAGVTQIDNGDPVATSQQVFNANVSKSTHANTSEINTKFWVADGTVYGTATGVVKVSMGGVIGMNSYEITVSAAATRQVTPVCVLGLNAYDKGSFDVNGNPQFNASCAVQANSDSDSGMTQEGNASVRAARFGITGKQKTNNFMPTPVDGSAKISDPFASLPFPSSAACDATKKALVIQNSMDLNPGTYCGGITINSAAVRMAPGIYVMVDGPFLVKGGGVVTGDNVMIGFTGSDSTLRLWGNSSVTLTSPTSGTYANMQFMVDTNSDGVHHTWVSIGGSDGNPDGTPQLTYDGVAYFATQNFWIFGNAVVNANSPNLAVVADKIWAQGSATINITNENRRNLSVASPPQSPSGARLLNYRAS